MRKLITSVLALALVAALATTAIAQTPSATDTKNAAKYCKSLRTSSGSAAAFTQAVKAVVGAKKVTDKNAYGKCVSQQAKNNASDQKQAKSNAAKDCKAEQAMSDSDFAAAHGGKTFAQQYGTNKNGRNAYGNCVSQKASANAAQAKQENQNELNAAKQCKTESKDSGFAGAHGGKTFAQFYGTNANGKNAFGKCVSSKAKAMNDQQEGAGQQS